jgi:uncharacterized protein (DUF697 family)
MKEVFEIAIRKSMEMPGAHISRTTFLKKTLSKYCSDDVVNKAIETTPSLAGIDKKIISKVANESINIQCAEVTSLSFAAGIPGGITMAATIPADLIQFHFQTIQIVQKLMYLYGWPDSETENKIDDDMYAKIIVLLGVAYGIESAQRLASNLANRLAVQVSKRLPQKALSKNAIYVIVKKVCAWIGVKVTKDTFAKSVSKAIPIIGGVVSGGMSFAAMKSMTNNLKKYLEATPLADKSKVVECESFEEIDLDKLQEA